MSILYSKKHLRMFVGQTVHLTKRGFTIFIFLLVSIMLIYRFIFNGQVNDLKSQSVNQFIDLNDLLHASIDAAKRGGQKVYEIREKASLREKSKGKTAEGANDPVTDGDMQSHLEMYHSIKNAFPNLKVVSEENPGKDLDIDSFKVLPANLKGDGLSSGFTKNYVDVKDIRVWIDPLDATQEYTENLRQYVTTMVCVAVKGVPTIGVIHKPFENFTAWAWVGQGHNPKLEVKKNEEKLPQPPIKVIVSRSHKGSVISQAQEAFGEDVKVTPAGGAGYKVLEVISGRQDVYFHSTLIKKWDICAGDAILSHFKGHMTTMQGFEIDYSSEIHYKNPDGLLASLSNHEFYLQKLRR